MPDRKKPKHSSVFAGSLCFTIVLVICSLFFTDRFNQAITRMFQFLTARFGWFYLLAVTVFVFFCLWLALSRYGAVKLGGDDSEPEYGTLSWFAMLFAAGMGVGLVFWGTAEPLCHFTAPYGLEAGTVEAADFAIRASFMHWGIHPWAIYGIVGLTMAYFGFRKGRTCLVSSTVMPSSRFAPLLSDLTDMYINILTAIGIATTFGLSVLQINSGLSMLTGIPSGLPVQILIICIATGLFLLSATSGIGRGIRLVSNFNLLIALLLLLLAFLAGPTNVILNSLTNGIGQYLAHIIPDSFQLNAYGDNSWFVNWRIFYWTWWVSWAPFVGCFIARISKGRTIRQFILGVLVAPTAASFLWFACFGNLGIDLYFQERVPLDLLAGFAAVPETAIFRVFSHYPLGTLMSVLAVVLLLVFFVSSADSGTFVLAMFSSNGNLLPSNRLKVVWGVTIAALSVGLLISGGVEVVQRISIVSAFPFIFIMLIACLNLLRELRGEALGK